MSGGVVVEAQTTSDTAAQFRSVPTTDDTRAHADLVRSRLRSSVMRSRSLDCLADGIVVSLSKQLIQVGN